MVKEYINYRQQTGGNDLGYAAFYMKNSFHLLEINGIINRKTGR